MADVMLRVWLAASAALFTTACASLPEPRLSSCEAAHPPAITYSADGRTASMRLDVLTYNIEGLHWPARHGRAGDLGEIGDRLADLRVAGQAPDVVLFQEMFSGAAVRSVEAAGYPALVSGPAMRQRRSLPSDGRVPGPRKWRRGEFGMKFASGGLAIASRYPILEQKSEPYSRRSCAGLDCLSNKGALFARLAIPGVPEPIDLFNTHMNARHASRASPRRSLASHNLEARELADFMEAAHPPENPAILGGDFNMRGSEARFDGFEPLLPMSLVHRYCLEARDRCDVRMSWDGDEPWMDTQDLQFFKDGRRVSVRPLRVEAMFDGSPDSPALSDHDGFRVTYELSWRTDGPPAATGACAPTAPLSR